MISRPLVEQLIVQLERSSKFCENARSLTKEDMYDTTIEPTQTYAGASGYARATMRDVLQTLESALG